MALTTAQLTTLKAAIVADATLNALPQTPDGADAIAKAFNLQAVPDFTVYKSSVTLTEVGLAMRNTDIASLTTANTNRLSVLGQYSGGIFYPFNADTWSGFDDIFSVAGAAPTRANLLALRKRFAKRGEKLYATGTGSDASPATLVFEGNIQYQDVIAARALP